MRWCRIAKGVMLSILIANHFCLVKTADPSTQLPTVADSWIAFAFFVVVRAISWRSLTMTTCDRLHRLCQARYGSQTLSKPIWKWGIERQPTQFRQGRMDTAALFRRLSCPTSMRFAIRHCHQTSFVSMNTSSHFLSQRRIIGCKLSWKGSIYCNYSSQELFPRGQSLPSTFHFVYLSCRNPGFYETVHSVERLRSVSRILGFSKTVKTQIYPSLSSKGPKFTELCESMSLSDSVNRMETMKRFSVWCGVSLTMMHVSVAYMMMMRCWKPSHISLSPGKKICL